MCVKMLHTKNIYNNANDFWNIQKIMWITCGKLNIYKALKNKDFLCQVKYLFEISISYAKITEYQ